MELHDSAATGPRVGAWSVSVIGRRALSLPQATRGTSQLRTLKREADVARLVADGLSNKQIKARLFISGDLASTGAARFMKMCSSQAEIEDLTARFQ